MKVVDFGGRRIGEVVHTGFVSPKTVRRVGKVFAVWILAGKICDPASDRSGSAPIAPTTSVLFSYISVHMRGFVRCLVRWNLDTAVCVGPGSVPRFVVLCVRWVGRCYVPRLRRSQKTGLLASVRHIDGTKLPVPGRARYSLCVHISPTAPPSI